MTDAKRVKLLTEENKALYYELRLYENLLEERNIKEVKIVRSVTPEMVEKEVNDYLQNGWVLHGELLLKPADDQNTYSYFVQMIKKEGKHNEEIK